VLRNTEKQREHSSWQPRRTTPLALVAKRGADELACKPDPVAHKFKIN
jgi:hypothetical protein